MAWSRLTGRPSGTLSSDPHTPAPAATDELGRSARTFPVDVLVRSGGGERRAVARDIHAVTAPLVVEAVGRVRERPGEGLEP
ncbi:hypothetical protein [Streptomyces sp. XY152]|uniref:hypothetical protein n=1 Tax=Streptomyces sp. XY152 TaxID=1415560 RepID=UPI0006AFE8D8|nr:hypothetical protein ADK58_08980 [Streptomyces sp. XY152]